MEKRLVHLNFPPIFVCLTLLLVTIAPKSLKCVSWSKISNISNFCIDFDLETQLEMEIQFYDTIARKSKNIVNRRRKDIAPRK